MGIRSYLRGYPVIMTRIAAMIATCYDSYARKPTAGMKNFSLAIAEPAERPYQMHGCVCSVPASRRGVTITLICMHACMYIASHATGHGDSVSI